jgi:ribosome-associated protein
LVATTLDDLKAEDVVVIDLKGRTSIADSMVIATGRSQRQVGAMADYVERALKQAGQKVSVEGVPQCDWVLVDGGDIIVHLFRPEVRAFYNLEKMWGVLEAKADSPTASAVRAKALSEH